MSDKKIKVSIVCLIYKSTKWLQFVYDQVKKYTNLDNKEFYFVANDANENVLNYLKINNIPHYIHSNTDLQKQEWYINNVYRAWNTGCKMAKGEYVVLLNSDMAFTPNWLEKLLDTIEPDTCVCSRLVERSDSGTYGIEQNFGNVPCDYNENAFIEYVKTIEVDDLRPGGLYMPILIKKEHLEKIGYYPEGNILPDSDIFNPVYAKEDEPCIPGDKVFIKKLNTINVKHYTNFGSIVYHFQEGEMRDTSSEIKQIISSIHHSDFISYLANIYRPNVYVELGLYDGETLSKVYPYVGQAYGIDIKKNPVLDALNSKSNIDIFYTDTDTFFSRFNNKIDMIFIDADHKFESAKRDFDNALRLLNDNGVILMHDTDPISNFYINPQYCGDSYKIVELLENNNDVNIVTLPILEAGLSIITKKNNTRTLLRNM